MCTCISQVNKLLAEHNTKISMVDTINMKTGRLERRMCVPTERINARKRGSPMRVFVTYCPMCGQQHFREEEK